MSKQFIWLGRESSFWSEIYTWNVARYWQNSGAQKRMGVPSTIMQKKWACRIKARINAEIRPQKGKTGSRSKSKHTIAISPPHPLGCPSVGSIRQFEPKISVATPLSTRHAGCQTSLIASGENTGKTYSTFELYLGYVLGIKQEI